MCKFHSHLECCCNNNLWMLSLKENRKKFRFRRFLIRRKMLLILNCLPKWFYQILLFCWFFCCEIRWIWSAFSFWENNLWFGLGPVMNRFFLGGIWNMNFGFREIYEILIVVFVIWMVRKEWNWNLRIYLNFLIFYVLNWCLNLINFLLIHCIF